MDENLKAKLMAEIEAAKQRGIMLDFELKCLREENKRLKQEYRDWVNKNIKYISKKSMASIIKDMLNGNV